MASRDEAEDPTMGIGTTGETALKRRRGSGTSLLGEFGCLNV
jgi:hypothetical protein